MLGTSWSNEDTSNRWIDYLQSKKRLSLSRPLYCNSCLHKEHIARAVAASLLPVVVEAVEILQRVLLDSAVVLEQTVTALCAHPLG